MNRTTLVMMLLAAATVAVAQEPPVRPTPPARPTPSPRPAAPARPAPPARPVDVAPPATPEPPDVWVPMTVDVDAMRESARALAQVQRELSRVDVQAARDAAREAASATRDIDYDRIAEATEIARAEVDRIAPRAIAGVRWSDDVRTPRPFFQQGDPEDSLYRLAHDVLNRGDYGRAAQMFKDIAQKYPKSVYADDLPYYEAWARYRIGTTEELHKAAKLLEPRASKLTGNFQSTGNAVYIRSRRGASDGDVVTLYTRINSVLASRGDREAAERVEKLAQAGANTCNREEMQVRVEAMSALTQMDPATALPIIRRVLDKKDDCTADLRQRAVFILGRRGDAEAANLIAAAAKSDPSRSVRMEAINWLPKLQGDAGVAALEDLLRTENDERIQRSIIRTLQSSDNAKARSSMRALIDRKDAPIALRLEAINSYNSDRATAEDAAYLRSLYGRTDDERIKNAIINTVARIGGQENEQWVLAIARNSNESSQARGTAISRLVRSNVAINDLTKLYDISDAYNVRAQIVGVLERRKEPEATNKLIDIARTSTVPQLRLEAIQALSRKNDPRASQALLELIDGSKQP